MAVNATVPGVLKVAIYGATPLTENGLLMNLKFSAIGNAGSVSPLRWTRILLNEGTPHATNVDGEVKISSAMADYAAYSKWLENDVSFLTSTIRFGAELSVTTAWKASFSDRATA